MFSLRHPGLVLGFDLGLARDIGAAEGALWGKPGGGILIALGCIGRTVDGDQVQWVVGEV